MVDHALIDRDKAHPLDLSLSQQKSVKRIPGRRFGIGIQQGVMAADREQDEALFLKECRKEREIHVDPELSKTVLDIDFP